MKSFCKLMLKLLGWKAKTKFSDLVKLMIKTDMEKIFTRGY